MKKKSVLLFVYFAIAIPSFAEPAKLQTFFKHYFGTTNYQVDEYKTKNEYLYFAYLSEKNDEIIQKGILVKQDDDDINPMLYIDKNEICNAYEMLVSPEIKTQIFYGWKTSLKVSNTNISFYASLCTDNGKHKADDIVFIFNENKFVRFVPDLSVY